MKAIKVLIVDDSALIRSLLTHIISSQPDLIVVGAACDALTAREMIRTLNPDVITLDIEMPHMDGLDFLERLMRLRPTPVLMVSTFTESGADPTLRALELGAVDFIAKPKADIQRGMNLFTDEIAQKIRIAARSSVRRLPAVATQPAATCLPMLGNRRASSERIVFIGASTGGTEAIRNVLVQLPPDAPAIMITQHMPAGFTRNFANRLNNACRITVKEAEQGERVLPGHAYIAPGSRHMLVERRGASYIVALTDTNPVNRHRPSVEVLFRSAARHVGRNAVGIMLSGMGKDGASAMVEMKQMGAYNIAQDEATCVVFGMPAEAIALGAVDAVLPVQDIAARVMQYLGMGQTRANTYLTEPMVDGAQIDR
jgi:two-component system, chemotaxis family, protein-glutamate methylesterase/glutaminase